VQCHRKAEKGHVVCREHIKKSKEVSRRNVKTLKEAALNHYGNHRCNWPMCKITDSDMLTLDHVKDDGAKARKKVRRLGVVLFGYLRKHGWPIGFQVLCGNHQLKKELMNRRGDKLPRSVTECRNITKF
jgi:hypothetical protein